MGIAVSHCKDAEEISADEGAKELEAKGGKVEGVVEAKEVEKEEDAEEAKEAEEDSQDDEEEDESQPDIEVKSIPYDPRFPTTNQARNCYTRYNEFYRCKGLKSEDDDECKFYQRAYRSICPGEWVEKWNEQREAGTWQGKY